MKTKLLIIILILIPNLVFCQLSSDSSSTKQKLRDKQLKINLFPALGGRVDISFEHLIPGKGSYDVGLNLIGLITSDWFAPKGVIAHAGYKFFFQSLPTNEEESGHPFSGLYFEPLIMGGYTQAIQAYQEYLPEPQKGFNIRERSVSAKYGAAFMNIGRQFVLYRRLSIDLTAGLGVGTYTGRQETTNDDAYTPAARPQNFGFMILGPGNILGLSLNAPLAVNAGIRLGYVFR